MGFKDEFGIQSPVPEFFDGVPAVVNLSATFYRFTPHRKPNDIPNLWEVFDAAIAYADDQSDANRARFVAAYDKARKNDGVKWNMTMALFWIRPFFYISLDSRNRWFLTERNGLGAVALAAASNMKDKLPNAEGYLSICELAKSCLEVGINKCTNLPELSYEAWRVSEEVNHWVDKGSWPNPGPSAVKTLTDITASTEYVQKLEDLFDECIADKEPATGLAEVEIEPYSKEDFLEEVYLSEPEYDRLASLVRMKKNVILQGAPGVGKTFMAKRLAYSLMGCKDRDRVKLVQFHQSYSYEDFIMGYRPTQDGFELRTGVFYDFCKQAADDPDSDYFFIIDEINRGNLSKIFGELFMLVEPDKRGVSLQLLYANEQFSVPPNLYLIGMMNTADRSLAMMDYALRRRFAFCEIEPAFGGDGFRAYREELADERFDRLIVAVEQLNDAIASDSSLGRGFRIGHSYFCGIREVTFERLALIVDFELVPLLEEYWFDEPAKVADWSARLRNAIR